MKAAKPCWLGILLLAVAGRAEVPVLRDGQILRPVLVAADATREEQAAAAELARVLGVMAGRDWPMQQEQGWRKEGIYVGRNDPGPRLKPAADLLAPAEGETGPDGFRIRSHDGSVFIEGATPEATGFAVAWLLQRTAGVRWYAPGPEGEVIPRRRDFAFPDLDVIRQPAYVSREIYDLNSPDASDWSRRNGLRGRLEFNHALGGIFPPAVLDEHPDWAPLLRGQRHRPVSPGDSNWQPNLALPAVAEHAAGFAAEAFRREPGRASVSLAMNDTLRFDQGPETRALVEPLKYFRGKPDYSPLVFTFMNRAAEALGEAGTGRYLGCLAYFWCENPPPFAVNPRVVPYVTTDRTQYYDAAYRAADLDLMSRWSRSGVRAYGLWEYAEGGNFLVPRVPVAALADAIREGWRRGARGYFAEMGAQGGFDRFKAWALAQLLWEPERTVQELADDFFPGYYGKAAPPMRRFFDRCEAQWMAQSGPPYWLKFYQQEDQALLFPPAACRELRAELDAAAAVADTPGVAARVAQTARAFAVTEAYVAFDEVRRKLAALSVKDWETEPIRGEAFLAGLLGDFAAARGRLTMAFEAARHGESPAMGPTNLAYFVRNDPVPRLLWLAGRVQPKVPRQLLAKAAARAAVEVTWLELAGAMARGGLAYASSETANGFFSQALPAGQEPRWMFPLSGALPVDWEVRSAATETGRVAIVDMADRPGALALRVEGAWDTQVFQWRAGAAGRVYLATAQLRGESSPGNDSGLFLTFLSAEGQVVGTHRMQCLPKGATTDWRTMVLADRAPENTAWVGVGFGASRQGPRDWVEANGIGLRSVAAENGP